MHRNPSIKTNLQRFTDDMRERSDVALKSLDTVKTAIIIGVTAMVVIALVVLLK